MAQRLAGLLGERLRLPLGAAAGPRTADVQHPPSMVVQQQRVGRVDVPVECERQIHDRVLQPLTRVQRDDLRCGGIGLESSDTVGGDLGPGVGPSAS